ncbi:DUF1801 domain-containing protein [Chloroflexota bacterium]
MILDNLPSGYEEVMNWGMITYQVPLAVYPDTFNKKPLMYAALSSQKNHMAVYLMGIYLNEQKLKWFEEEYAATGKKMDKGKSCVRFKKLEDLPLPLIGKAIGTYSIIDFVEQLKKLRQTPNKQTY